MSNISERYSIDNTYKILALKTALRAIITTMNDNQKKGAKKNAMISLEKLGTDVPALHAEIKIINSLVQDIFKQT